MWYFGSNGGQDGVHIPKELWPEYYKGLWRGVKPMTNFVPRIFST